jgi:hypothetical protein
VDPTLRNYEAQTAVEVATGGTKTLLLDSVSRATESSHRLLLQAAWQGNIEVIRRLLVGGFLLFFFFCISWFFPVIIQ